MPFYLSCLVICNWVHVARNQLEILLHMYIQAGFLSVSWYWDSSYGHVTAMLAVTPWD